MKVAVASFFATCYPTREGEQGLLKIADTRYFALRGEPTTKHSGWRCPRRHDILNAAERATHFCKQWTPTVCALRDERGHTSRPSGARASIALLCRGSRRETADVPCFHLNGGEKAVAGFQKNRVDTHLVAGKGRERERCPREKASCRN